MKIRKFVIYVKKNFVLMKIIKTNLEKCKKSEIIVILQENIEELLIVIVPIKKVIDNDNDNDSDSNNDIDKDKNKVKTVTYRLKFIDSYRFMQDSLSNLVDNLSGIDNKKPENKFADNMRSMTDSLSQSVDKVSEINREILQIDEKESKNKFIDNTRSTVFLLTQSIKYQRLIIKYHNSIKKNQIICL